MKTIEDVKIVVAAAHQYDIDLFWYINEIDEVRAAVLMNDVFFWGCSDCEDVEVEDLPALKEAMIDNEGVWGPEIYAARKRKMRPQNAIINGSPLEVRKAFLEAGPERPVDHGNPKELE
jgi:hypothetical protein